MEKRQVEQADVDGMVRAIVAEELQASLQPIGDALTRIAHALEAVASQCRTPEPKKAPAQRRGRGQRSAVASPAPSTATAIRPGQKVRYPRDGIEHDGIVQAVESSSGMALVVGPDGSEAVCPVGKLSLAPAANPGE